MHLKVENLQIKSQAKKKQKQALKAFLSIFVVVFEKGILAF